MNKSPYSRTRNRQLVRVLRLMALLGEGWMHLDRLSSELSVTTRTIRRDLAAIEEAHLPLRKGSSDLGKSYYTLRMLPK